MGIDVKGWSTQTFDGFEPFRNNASRRLKICDGCTIIEKALPTYTIFHSTCERSEERLCMAACVAIHLSFSTFPTEPACNHSMLVVHCAQVCFFHSLIFLVSRHLFN